MHLKSCKCVFGIGCKKFLVFMSTQWGVKYNPKKCYDMLPIRCGNLKGSTPQ